MSSVLIGLVVVAVPLALIAFANSPSQEATGAPPGPGAEHKKLEAWVGTWDAEVEMMGQVSRGVETCRLDLGGFWLVTDFNGSAMGAPYLGHGLTGVDPAKGKTVVVWADSMGSPLTVAEGAFDASGKRFVAQASGVDMTGQPARFEHVTTFEGRDKRTFEILQLAEGGQKQLAMRIRYTRRK
jgi:hypothetical protein